MAAPQIPSLDEQRRFWDWHWCQWQGRKTINEWKQKRHETILAFLQFLQLDRPRILDLGCGPGWYTDRLSHLGPTTGIDLSEEAIAMARSRFPNITFVCGNLYDFPFPESHFDVLACQEVFDHVEDQPALLRRATQLLKPGGHFILSCTNKFVLDRLTEGERFPTQPAEHIAKYLTPRTVYHLLSAYFRVLRMATIIPMGHGGILRLTNSHKLNSLLQIIISPVALTTLKERAGLGYQIIVLAQKPTES